MWVCGDTLSHRDTCRFVEKRRVIVTHCGSWGHKDTLWLVRSYVGSEGHIVARGDIRTHCGS